MHSHGSNYLFLLFQYQSRHYLSVISKYFTNPIKKANCSKKCLKIIRKFSNVALKLDLKTCTKRERTKWSSVSKIVYRLLSELEKVKATSFAQKHKLIPTIQTDYFHEHLNSQNADIQFTKEIEENGKIPFLDCLVTRDHNKLQTTIYRKPAHTDRFTRPVFVQPDLSLGYYDLDLDETSATSLRLT